MVQRSGKTLSGDNPEDRRMAEASDRKRLKNLAISRGMLSATPASSRSALNLSKAVLKHHGTDILRKSQRKNRYLFSFPGLLGPVSGGKIGELKDLGTKNPILYLDFPQGRLKLLGTIVYPKNRYLTLQFSRGGKNVMCEDYFDNMIVFSDAWWIGQKEENPEEHKLEIPVELLEVPKVECDFHGGAGVPGTQSIVENRCSSKKAEVSTDNEVEAKPETEIKVLENQTPTRSSGRIAGRKFKFVDHISEADSSGDDAKPKHDTPSRRVLDYNGESDINNDAQSKGSLVQSTVSSMFKKVLEKKHANSSLKRKSDEKRRQPIIQRKADGVDKAKKSKRLSNEKVEEDAIEEFSSSCEDTNGSDEDWIH